MVERRVGAVVVGAAERGGVGGGSSGGGPARTALAALAADARGVREAGDEQRLVGVPRLGGAWPTAPRQERVVPVAQAVQEGRMRVVDAVHRRLEQVRQVEPIVEAVVVAVYSHEVSSISGANHSQSISNHYTDSNCKRKTKLFISNKLSSVT